MSIHTFRDLIAWQKSHALTLDIYKITKEFPKDEIFGLTNQIRRAAVSIVSNIAEGFGRRSAADRTHFYDMARASLHEVQAQLLVARDVGYIGSRVHEELDEASIECHKVLTGLINKTNGTK
jgi:four helix bundle protein